MCYTIACAYEILNVGYYTKNLLNRLNNTQYFIRTGLIINNSQNYINFNLINEKLRQYEFDINYSKSLGYDDILSKFSQSVKHYLLHGALK